MFRHDKETSCLPCSCSWYSAFHPMVGCGGATLHRSQRRHLWIDILLVREYRFQFELVPLHPTAASPCWLVAEPKTELLVLESADIVCNKPLDLAWMLRSLGNSAEGKSVCCIPLLTSQPIWIKMMHHNLVNQWFTIYHNMDSFVWILQLWI